MTDTKTKAKEITIKVVQAANGGFALHVDNIFDAGCSKGDEALEWFAKQMSERFGELTRRAADHGTLLDQIAGKVAEQMRLQPPQQPQQPTRPPLFGNGPGQYPLATQGGRLPPELPEQDPSEPMPRVVEGMRGDDEVSNLTARLAGEMGSPHRNGGLRSSVIAVIAIPVAIFLWRAATAVGLS